MKSLFETNSKNEILERIEKLTPEAQPIWGKMNSGQMLKHCQFPLQIAMGKDVLPKPNALLRFIFKSFKKSMYNDAVWKKNQPTPKEFKVTSAMDFQKEKASIVQWITDFSNQPESKEIPDHPAFGHFTREQWGKMQYKHLNHHLDQFGV